MPNLSDVFPLRPARVHEVCGPAATAFAAICCGLDGPARSGPVLWCRPAWQTGGLNPQGLLPFCPPDRLLIAQAPSPIDLLAIAEEALRDGVLALVVAEITKPLDLRQGRRLQLAAKEGATTGLCLIPEGMGSNAAETRSRVTPVFDPDAAFEAAPMRWDLLKNKSGPIGEWMLHWNALARRLEPAPPAPTDQAKATR